MLRDLEGGEDAQIAAVVQVISHAAPDILLLTSFDYDRELVALEAFADLLAQAGTSYPYLFAFRPNTGLASGIDLDGDGRLGGPGDAQGFGYYAGQGGMAILSRYPIDDAGAQDFSGLLWRDLPDVLLPEVDNAPFPSDAALAVQRLSTTGHWAVPVILPSGVPLTLLAWHATPPVFDGPEDRNGKRNHDETAFWTALLDGRLGFAAPRPPFVILGDANLDPLDGDGRGVAMQTLLAHPAVSDPAPASLGGAEAAMAQGGANRDHAGLPALDTADWDDTGPGNLRVDYVLPSADLTVSDAGVLWPEASQPLADIVAEASRHRLVWIDIQRP